MRNLRVILLHGTWGAGSEWKDAGSWFENQLREQLAHAYAHIRFDAIAWNAKNRWNARTYVAQQLDRRLAEYQTDDDESWEYLLVAHSHGGNIATEAVRERMRKDSTVPIIGVACLNTPFLKHEVRASASYLKTWVLLTLALGLSLIELPSVQRVLSVAGKTVPFEAQSSLAWSLLFLSAILLLLLLLSLWLGRSAAQDPNSAWWPRPEVLCLSCADDEAITLLGLFEGIANLPQLLLHPIGLALALMASGVILYAHPGPVWCAVDFTCWSVLVQQVSQVFVGWLVLALAGGIVGTFVVSVMFGLSLRLSIESLVSRVLVSYVPLRPANAHFRAVSDIALSWVNPLQLFHSQIYRSPRTATEICTWLLHCTKNRGLAGTGSSDA